jgi:hypothetical protein
VLARARNRSTYMSRSSPVCAPPGTRTPNPLILGLLLRLFVDSADYLRFCDSKRSLPAVIWRYLDVFCDHKMSKRSAAQHNHETHRRRRRLIKGAHGWCCVVSDGDLFSRVARRAPG